MRAVGIDIGGSHAVCAVVEDQRILAAESLPVGGTSCLAGLLPALAANAARLLELCGLTAGGCDGVAVSFPGIVDPFAGRILSTPEGKYDDAGLLDLGRWSRECFGLPLRIENDVRMALLGERYCGAVQGCDDAVMVTLGTGVGGAVLAGGRLFRGKHLQAGFGGHLPVLFHGRACICGSRGCVEAEASTWALPEICRAWPDQVLPFLEQYIHVHAWTPWGKVRVLPAAMGPDAGLLGAVPLLAEPC